MSFTSDSRQMEGTVVSLPGNGPRPGVVLVFSAQCLARGKALGFAQVLALHGLAVLIFDSPDCMGDTKESILPLAQLSQDALAGVAALAERPEVDSSRVGLWGQDNGARVVIRAAAQSLNPAFVVATYSTPQEQSPALRGDLAGILAPSLFLFSGSNPQRQWQDMISDVTALRQRRGRQFEVQTLRGLGEDQDPDAEALKPLSLRYARVAGPWIKGLSD